MLAIYFNIQFSKKEPVRTSRKLHRYM